eukprot:9306374-Lingulodinium_polyedra.AAC.2
MVWLRRWPGVRSCPPASLWPSAGSTRSSDVSTSVAWPAIITGFVRYAYWALDWNEFPPAGRPSLAQRAHAVIVSGPFCAVDRRGRVPYVWCFPRGTI